MRVDIKAIHEEAGHESARVARAMKLEPGDQMDLAGHTYVIIDITKSTVIGQKISENGRFVSYSNFERLDLRHRGWSRVIPTAT